MEAMKKNHSDFMRFEATAEEDSKKFQVLYERKEKENELAKEAIRLREEKLKKMSLERETKMQEENPATPISKDKFDLLGHYLRGKKKKKKN